MKRHQLRQRLKARTFADLLTSAEAADWHAFVRGKLADDSNDWLAVPAYFRRLDELTGSAPPALLDELRRHGERVETTYGAADTS